MPYGRSAGLPCKRCRREAVERVRALRRERMLQGLCVYCGNEPPDLHHWGCRPCLDVKRAKRKKRFGKGAMRAMKAAINRLRGSVS